VIGPGDAGRLDRRYVKYLGVIPYEGTWDYLHFAHVGVELVKGEKFMHNNESSKVYHYLRAGLPVVSEEGLPNNDLIEKARLGFVVKNSDLELMAQKIEEAAHSNWDRTYAINYILDNHTWDKRAEIYDKIIKEHFRVIC
jgi:glycosyltransferase involved in cell wall biosynthesis